MINVICSLFNNAKYYDDDIFNRYQGTSKMSTSQPTRIHPTFIGVIHLPALPGDAHGSLGDYEPSYQAALNDAKSLLAGGVEGIIVENFGSAPFQRGTRQDPAPPHQVAALTVIARELRALSNTVQIGINCLRNDAIAALGIAAATSQHAAALVRPSLGR